MNVLAEFLRGIVGAHNKNRRIIPCETSHHIRYIHAVQSGRGCGSQPRHGIDDHNILGYIKGRNTLPKNRAQTLREVQAGLSV